VIAMSQGPWRKLAGGTPRQTRSAARDHAAKSAYEQFLENVERDDVPQFSFLNPGDIGGSMTDQCFEEVQRFFQKITKNENWFYDFEAEFSSSIANWSDEPFLRLLLILIQLANHNNLL